MGLLFGTGFDPLGWQWLSLLALVGFFLVYAARPTPFRAALAGFLFGLGWFVPGLSWTMNSIAVHGRLPWAAAALALLVLGAVLSLFPAFACWTAKKIGGGRLVAELPGAGGALDDFGMAPGRRASQFWLAHARICRHRYAFGRLGAIGRNICGYACSASFCGACRGCAQLQAGVARGACDRARPSLRARTGVPPACVVGAVLYD